MRIQTFSVVLGTPACDASCPFCISHITGFENLPKIPAINLRNFEKACKFATMGGCTTALITGKGEPTLYPDELTTYLTRLQAMGDPFPFIELQTNGIQIGYLARRVSPLSEEEVAILLPKYQRLRQNHLANWQHLGLNTIALSVVSIDPAHNKIVYKEDYPPLEMTIKYLHDLGYTVRLCVMMQKGMVDSVAKIFQVANWCRKNGVAQLTLRPIRAPDLVTVSTAISKVATPTSEEAYVRERGLHAELEENIRRGVEHTPQVEHILTLMHGAHAAKVYDYDGQNICMSDCLTMNPESDDIRTLIYYSDGKLSYAWQHDGARLL